MKRIGEPMKKFLLIPLLVLLFACGPALVPQEAESTVGITAPDAYSIACITGFVRTAPHICLLNGATNLNPGAITYDACSTWVVSASLPSNTRAVVLEISLQIDTANVVNIERSLSMNVYTTNACTLNVGQLKYGNNEWVANVTRPAGNLRSQFFVPVFSGNLFYLVSRSSCATCLATIKVVGYYD